ncbi:MAG: hypothetical protein NVS2B3_04960 [Vulcanimicrobiaceae bacterium]
MRDREPSRMMPLPSGATAQAVALHQMWAVFFWSGIGVAAVVYGLIAWCLIRYRKRTTDRELPVQFRRNDRMELVYTGVPILMVVALFFMSDAAERHVETIAAHEDVVVDVTGFRWSWRFEYPKLGVSVAGERGRPPEFVLPIDETTRLNVTSVDVDHSFWVPDFLFKRDAIPGLRNVFDWTPKKLGTYRGECGEFCGLDHATMSFAVRVVSHDAFVRWAAAHRRVAFVSHEAAR